MTQQHTPEPWKVSLEDSTPEWSVITAAGGRVVANINEETGPELIAGVPVMRVVPGELNARRIVACVNACRGLPTDELEQKGLVAAVGTQLLAADGRSEGQERVIRKLASTTADAENKLADALNQRDELLEVLEISLAAMEHMGNALNEFDAVTEEDEEHFATFELARAAIAKAKGGAV